LFHPTGCVNVERKKGRKKDEEVKCEVSVDIKLLTAGRIVVVGTVSFSGHLLAGTLRSVNERPRNEESPWW
jgi:hypothetical protein